jgi:hypothetical protein
MSTRSPYATDLCDDEWEILEPSFPQPNLADVPELTKRARY